MIYYIHEQKSKSNNLDVLLAIGQFISITFFCFYSFTDICFDTIDRVIPSPLIIAILVYMYLDVIYGLIRVDKFFVKAIFNLIITILLMLSWLSVNKYVVYLGASIYLRTPEIFYFYQTVHQRLRPYYVLYRLFIIFRLLYWMLVISQVFGCIFYLIDANLIQQEYFESIYVNPGLYYQGQIVTFTPIYGLPQAERYIYAMYYIASLVSTVAYGDIIPKNHIENSYVIVLLVLSTISLSFILEEMIMVFRRDKQIRNQMISKAKYFIMMLSKTTLTHEKRNYLTRLLVHKMLKQKYTPKIAVLSEEIKKKLRLETLCNTCYEGDEEIEDRVLEISQVHQCMPLIVSKYVLFEMTHIIMPAGITFMNNKNRFQKITFFILIQGKIETGYTNQLKAFKKIYKHITDKKSKPVLLGWKELLLNTTANNYYYQARTGKTSDFYSLSEVKFKAMLKEYRKSKQIEFYMLAKEEEMLNEYCMCSICNKKGHEAYQCPQCHLSVDVNQLMVKGQNKRDKKFKRGNQKVSKYHKKNHIRNEFSENDFTQQQSFSKILYHNVLTEFHSLMLGTVDQPQSALQGVQQYSHFHPEYNIL